MPWFILVNALCTDLLACAAPHFKEFGYLHPGLFTLYQCTHADSFLIPVRSRIYETHSEARPVLLLLPYFPPQDGIKSLFCH